MGAARMLCALNSTKTGCHPGPCLALVLKLALIVLITLPSSTGLKCHRCSEIYHDSLNSKIKAGSCVNLGKGVKTEMCGKRCVVADLTQTRVEGGKNSVRKGFIRRCEDDNLNSSMYMGSKCTRIEDKGFGQKWWDMEFADMPAEVTSGIWCFCKENYCLEGGASLPAISGILLAFGSILHCVWPIA